MATSKLRIGILGTGSCGGFLGGLLIGSSPDLEVLLVGRQTVLNDLQSAQQMVVTSHVGLHKIISFSQIEFSLKTEDLLRCDVILCCVKTSAVESAFADLAPLISQSPPAHKIVLISLQNGVGGPKSLSKALGTAAQHFTILGGIFGYGVAWEGNGKFHQSTDGHIYIEKPTTPSQPFDRFLELTKHTINPQLTSDIEGTMHGKLLVNLINPINALSGLTTGNMLADKNYRIVWGSAILEGLQVFKASGVSYVNVLKLPIGLLPYLLGSNVLFYVLSSLQKADTKGYSSMSQDLLHGRPTEIDSINGEILRMADSVGVECPVNRALVELIRKRSAHEIGAVSGPQLAKLTGVDRHWVLYNVDLLLALGVCCVGYLARSFF